MEWQERYKEKIVTAKDASQKIKAEIGDVENEIGRNCSLIIEDESTLQLGIGAILDAILLNLG